MCQDSLSIYFQDLKFLLRLGRVATNGNAMLENYDSGLAAWSPPPLRPPLLPVRSDRVTPLAAARLPRQARSQTRDDLLEAAARIVNEYVSHPPRSDDPPVDLLPFVRLDEVLEIASELARRRLKEEGGLTPEERVAPLTPGAFYKAFAEYQDGGRGATLTAFHRLVVRKMIDDELLTDADLYITLGQHLANRGQPWSEIARVGIEIAYKRWSATPALILFTALTLHAQDAEVADWTREIAENEIKQLTHIYDELLKLYKLKLRRGIALEHLATMVSGLVTGMALNARFMPESRDKTISVDIDGCGKKKWHLSALAAWAIYDSFLESDSD